MNARFVENAMLLGPRRSLVGVVTRPVAGVRNDRAAVIILNTGIVHRMGHHRMYVEMARALAAAGRTVLRFDFSGIGDSERRPGSSAPLETALIDVKEALDSLQSSHGTSRFVLLGLCSGADTAVLYGHADPRVVGLVLLDPSIPPTVRYYFHYVAQRLRSMRNWVSVIRGRSGLLRLLAAQLLHGMRPTSPTAGLTQEGLAFSPHLANCYRNSVSRGVQMLAIFTSISPRQTYRQQMLDAFPDVYFKDQLELDFFSDSDHLFSAPRDRSRLNQVVADWLAGHAETSQSSSSEQAATDPPDSRRGRAPA